MTRAEEAALLAYDTSTPAAIRIAYRDGYEQAEKDLINRIVDNYAMYANWYRED